MRFSFKDLSLFIFNWAFLIYTRDSTNQIWEFFFPVRFRNRLISALLKPVLSHIIKSCIVLHNKLKLYQFHLLFINYTKNIKIRDKFFMKKVFLTLPKQWLLIIIYRQIQRVGSSCGERNRNVMYCFLSSTKPLIESTCLPKYKHYTLV